ncbi:MAG TPA: hypothetical protein PKE12_04090 [Kiritimatiellia bacterium]|nr:hypothetical protein [Kiritimatiellia bacterium]
MSAAANTCVATIFSPEPEIAAAFVETLCGPGARNGKVNLNDIVEVVIEIGSLDSVERLADQIKSADFSIVLLHFMDEETLNKARAPMRLLTPQVQANIHESIARRPGEAEFKMSCPACGQKLMIKDALAFRRTQCPRCKHPFTIPGQADLVRAEFLVPSADKVSRALLGDVQSCADVLAKAFRQIQNRRPAEEMSTTMRLDDLIDADSDTK